MRSGLDPWYVTGFIDGEGSFTYSRAGRRFALYFAVRLTRADRAILQAIQAFFGGVGTIYDVGARVASPRSVYTKAASYYRVCRRDELERILAHFDAYPPRGAKAASYRIWREMVLLKLARPSDSSRQRLEVLAARLSAASPRNSMSARQKAPRARKRGRSPEAMPSLSGRLLPVKGDGSLARRKHGDNALEPKN